MNDYVDSIFINFILRSVLKRSQALNFVSREWIYRKKYLMKNDMINVVLFIVANIMIDKFKGVPNT